VFERWLAAVKPLVDGGRALEAVRGVSRFHRIQSTPGYDAAAAWLAGELRAAGLGPVVENVRADGRTRYLGCPLQEGWECMRAVATLRGSRGGADGEPLADFAERPLSLVQRSAPARGRFPLVVVEDGASPGDYEGVEVRGRVVVTNGPVQRVHALAVVERGAAGLLSDGRRLVPPARTRDHDRDSLAYTSYWWCGDEPRGWGFVLSPQRGEEVRGRLAAGEPLEIEVDIESRRFATAAPLVTATLPGEWPGEVLLTAHLCHPQPGANDNGSGVAATLEAARVLGRLVRDGALPATRRTIRFLWMPEFTGTFAWLAGDPERGAGTVAALNLDMVGESQADCGSTQRIECPPHFAGSFADELLARIRHASQPPAGGAAGPPSAALVRTAEVPYSGGSDHVVWIDPVFGVPCPLLIQWPDRYYHSDYDTPERCDPASLAHAARIGATYAASLACAGADEALALLAMAGRGARRRLLAALEAADPVRAARAERLRGELALASVQRLARGPSRAPQVAAALDAAMPLAVEEFEGFFEAEIEPALPAAARAQVPLDARVPVRRHGSALLPWRAHQPGMDEADPATREGFLGLDATLPGGATTVDLVWFACDGRRTVGEIAALVADEGVPIVEDDVRRVFDLTAALGASGWREAAPSTSSS
jgi:hypothetical protein